MIKIDPIILSAIILFSVALLPLSITAVSSPTLTIIEWVADKSYSRITLQTIPAQDDSITNTNYQLSGLIRTSTANYWINPSNKYGFSASSVVNTIQASASTWDTETSATVFAYKGTTTKAAGKYDGYNVIAWGTYNKGAIAVTYIWSINSQVVETDTRMNSLYKWSLSGEAKKMDAQISTPNLR